MELSEAILEQFKPPRETLKFPKEGVDTFALSWRNSFDVWIPVAATKAQVENIVPFEGN